MNITVPNIEDTHFKRLENLIDSEFEVIEILTEIDSSKKELDCFNIVQEQVKKFGGKMILGWQVWKSTILIEAEAHAVWEDLAEELHDISPKSSGASPEKILFIEDPRLKYEGKQIENIRLNITNNKLVDDFIELSKLFFHLQNKGRRAEYHDLSKILNQEEIKEIEEIVVWKSQLEQYIYLGNNEKNACFCGGLKNYKNCHGKNLMETKNKTGIGCKVN